MLMQKILIIQTAFIGDVVLATALIEKLHLYYPEAQIDFLLRKGNEKLLTNHPYLNKVLIWDKKLNKYRNLFGLMHRVRKQRYDVVVNVQRYFSTGLLTVFSGAKSTRGFSSNPMSFLFSKSIPHVLDINKPRHEIDRNNDLIKDITDETRCLPALYPSDEDKAVAERYIKEAFITMTPSSVWETKKMPLEKWIELIDHTDPKFHIYLLGGKDNKPECEWISQNTVNKNVSILAGTLDFLQSAALMKNACMNFTHDSAPLHFTSAMNAPVTAIFCSTVKGYGYTPLSDNATVVETALPLTCRPCGNHGKKKCPEGHFKCGNTIDVDTLINIANHAKRV
jgi:heptosyltransferase-2